MLRTWIRNRVRIANQKKASQQGRVVLLKSKEPEMELALYRKFEDGWRVGKSIRCA
jgi:hypothetical protein